MDFLSRSLFIMALSRCSHSCQMGPANMTMGFFLMDEDSEEKVPVSEESEHEA